jgi:hypothetical protein
MSNANSRDGVHVNPSADPHLEIVLLILRGIPQLRREEWMRRNMPRTYSMLGASQIFNAAVMHSHSQHFNELVSGSMQHPQRGAYL